MKSFHKQFCECSELGNNSKTEFLSFDSHPELLPAFPNEKFKKAVSTGKIKGIDIILCSKFGGKCSTANLECKNWRKEQEKV